MLCYRFNSLVSSFANNINFSQTKKSRLLSPSGRLRFHVLSVYLRFLIILFFISRHFFSQECVFTKNFSYTSLRVSWTGALRVYGCTTCCKRWYFTFNGAECSGPLPIDGIVSLGGARSVNPHRVRHIEGHCNNIHKGKVRVGFWVGNCQSYSRNGYDAYTGWQSVSRIYVEEISEPQA